MAEESSAEPGESGDNYLSSDDGGSPEPASGKIFGRVESFLSTDSRSLAPSDVADGEYLQLLKTVEDESPPLTSKVEAELIRQLSGEIFDDKSKAHVTDVTSAETCYGHPLTEEEAMEAVPPAKDDHDGIVWHCTIIPDDFFVDGKLRKGLNKRDFDHEKQEIKPRRPTLPVRASQFFSSLTKVHDGPNGTSRYIFHGVLNGWPSLRSFELMALEYRRGSTSIPEIISGPMAKHNIVWKKTWRSAADHHHKGGPTGAREETPILKEPNRVYRAKLRGPPWSSLGWSEDSPGFCFWYEAQRPEGPRLSYGTNMLKLVGEAQCTHIHMLSHRYANIRESPRDRLTYHSVCLLEWEHGEHCTVVEAAYLNGIGGFKGKSNWYDDKDEPICGLYRAFPPEMVSPWISTSAEIRCFDVAARTLAEFKGFVKKYEGPERRFVDPHFTFSHAARLTFRTKSQIAQYLLNYITRDSTYAELKRNCQTFTADLCSFLAGKKNVPPFHPVSRIDYQNRTYLFLYDSHMYKRKKHHNPV
jgi:hypothetical protein